MRKFVTPTPPHEVWPGDRNKNSSTSSRQRSFIARAVARACLSGRGCCSYCLRVRNTNICVPIAEPRWVIGSSRESSNPLLSSEIILSPF